MKNRAASSAIDPDVAAIARDLDGNYIPRISVGACVIGRSEVRAVSRQQAHFRILIDLRVSAFNGYFTTRRELNPSIESRLLDSKRMGCITRCGDAIERLNTRSALEICTVVSRRAGVANMLVVELR